MSDDPNYAAIQARIKQLYDNREEFLIHLVVYLTANAFVWWVLNPAGVLETLFKIGIGLWTIGFAGHAVHFVMKEAQARALERAIERELRRGGFDDAELKRKREHLALTDDGELLEIVAPEDDVMIAPRDRH